MRYHNFDLFIEEKEGAGYRLRADTEGYDSVRGWLRADADWAQIVAAAERLDGHQADRQVMIDVGTRLHEALFSAENRALSDRFQQYAGQFLGMPHEGVRLRLRIQAPEIAALPWEFLYSPVRGTFLGTWIRTPLVRYLDVGRPIASLETSLPIHMLIVIPDSPDLNADEEKNLLQKALCAVRPHVKARFIEGDVSLLQIEAALLKQPVHILHFIGHGDFLDDKGVLQLGSSTDPVDHEALGSVFRNHEDMKLVFLNSCKGARVSPHKPFLGIAPKLVEQGVPAVLAMQYSVYDDVAVLFSQIFYESLFRGTDRGRVDMAATHARNSLHTHYPGERAFGAPVLFLRSPDGVLFDLPEEEKVLRSLLSVGDGHRLDALAQTYSHTIQAIKDSGPETPAQEVQLVKAERRLGQIQQTLRYRTASWAAAAVIAFLVFASLWISILDLVGLDTRLESYTIALGGLFVHKELHEALVIVPIDAHTRQELGRERFDQSWRQDYPRLIRNLAVAGAKVIVFDITFEGPSESDSAIAQAISDAAQRGTSVVVGVRQFRDGQPVLTEELKSAVSGWGGTAMEQRLGGAMLVPVIMRKATVREPIPGLVLTATALYKGSDRVQVDYFDPNKEELFVHLDAETPEAKRVPLFDSRTRRKWSRSALSEVGDLVAYLAIDVTPVAALRDQSRCCSYLHILNHSDPGKLSQVRGKIVIVGVQTDTDRHGPRWGYELHADAINTLLNGVFIRHVGSGGQLALITILSAVGALIRTRLGNVPGRLVVLLVGIVLLVYLAGAVYLYARYRLVLNVVYPVVALLLTYWLVGRLERRYFP